MARVFLLMSEAAGPSGLIKKLRNAGHKPIVAEPKYPAFYELLKQQATSPDLFLADCGRSLSHVLESCNYIQSLKAYRGLPFLLFNLRKEDEARALEKVAGARSMAGADPMAAMEALLRQPSASKAP